MNGKQSKMLSAMRTTNAERREWQRMTAEEKGLLRAAFDSCPYMMHPSFSEMRRAADKLAVEMRRQAA